MKKQIITIAGAPGSGKSSTADLVSKELGYERFSSGNLFRQVGLELGLSINEVNIRAETDPEIDRMVDAKVRKIGEMEKVVLDTRLGYHWIPESFKVYLDLPLEIAKDRILNNLKDNNLRMQSEKTEDPEEMFIKISKRLESEKKRYMELYGIDYTDQGQYDLVIDTNKYNLKEVVAMIVSEYKKWLSN